MDQEKFSSKKKLDVSESFTSYFFIINIYANSQIENINNFLNENSFHMSRLQKIQLR